MLSAIYIKGFKTFARPVRMPLEGGVTVIVGPNGSGKSNITDAVLFALGEQSPSVLRAGGMGDVIFSGSETLSSAAAAEVTLVFDNSSGGISLPYEEVSVTRRISRGGETEYRINGVRSRLADVRAVAGEAGLGRHSVLRQGAVDAIVSGGASACRMALEEAAGLGVYRRRRVAASRKLERADAQLEKSRQLEEELSRQLRRIEGEAKAAREYRELEARHRKLSLAYLYRIATQDLDPQRLNSEKKESRVSELEEREESLREERANLEPGLRELETRLRETERALEALEDLSESARSESMRAERSALKLETTEGNERQRTASRLRTGLEKVEHALSDLRRKQEPLDREYSSKRGNLDRLKERESAARREHIDAENRKSRLVGTLERLRARIEREPDDGKAEPYLSASDLQQLSEIEEEAGKVRGAETRDGLDGLFEDLDRCASLARKLSSEVDRRRGMLSVAEGRMEAVIRELSLREESNGSGLRLYQVVRARPGFETALEAALGEIGDGILAGDLDEGIRLISGSERVAVRLDAHAITETEDAPGKPLSECVDVTDESYAEAVERILDGIYVVEDTNDSAPSNGYVAVTRGGMRLTRTSVSLNSGGRFEREARLAEEKKRLHALRNEPTALLTDLDWELSGATERVEDAAATAERLRALAGRADRMSSLISREARRRKSRTEESLERRARRREQNENLRGEISAAEQSLSETQGEIGESWERLSSATSAMETAQAEYDRTEESRRRVRSNVANLERRKVRISETLERHGTSSSEDGGRLAEMVGRTLRGAEEIGNSILRRRNGLRRSRTEDSESHRHLTSEQNHLASGASELTVELAQARTKAGKAREDLERAERDAKASEDEILTEWGATLDTARQEYESVAGNIEPERNRLARRIKNFGDVNLLALSQQTQLRERHELVSSQRSDAEAASTELKRIIQQVDREIEGRFDRTFGRVRDAFRKMVPVMLHGSSGDLEVSEEGVEISLRLGRRGSRPLQVLSGGERSLLALSFLFGIFLSQQDGSRRNFCMLDEAEAALDDVNLARFLSVVDSHRANGQFLLVTHQKRTMASADVLYGVTQDASGATVIVSKRLSGE